MSKTHFTGFSVRQLLIAGSLLAGITVGIYQFSIQSETQTFSDKIEECINDDQNINYSCLKSQISAQRTTPENSRLLIESLQKSTLNNHLTCHDLSHIVGQTLAENNSNLSYQEAQQWCGSECEFGCLHGYFVAQIKKSPDLFSTLPQACQHLESTDFSAVNSCYHMLGHASTELKNYEYPQALLVCDQLGSQHQYECARGVLMEYFTMLPTQEFPFPLTPPEFVRFCQNLQTQYAKDACHADIGRYVTGLSDIDAGNTTCMLLEPDKRGVCLEGVLGQYASTHSNQEVFEYCLKSQDAKECIQKVVKFYISNEYPREKIDEFCDQSPTDQIFQLCTSTPSAK